MNTASRTKLVYSLARFQFPILQKSDAEALNRWTFQADHRINPLPHTAILFEVTGIDQVTNRVTRRMPCGPITTRAIRTKMAAAMPCGAR